VLLANDTRNNIYAIVCAQKQTKASFIHRTEPKKNKRQYIFLTKKLMTKTDMLQRNDTGMVPGVSPDEGK